MDNDEDRAREVLRQAANDFHERLNSASRRSNHHYVPRLHDWLLPGPRQPCARRTIAQSIASTGANSMPASPRSLTRVPARLRGGSSNWINPDNPAFDLFAA